MEYSFPIVFDECLWGPHTFWSKHWKKFFSKVALKKKRNFVLGTQNNRKIWRDSNIQTKLKSKYFILFFSLQKWSHFLYMKWFKNGKEKKNTIMLFIVEKWNILLWTFHFKISWIHFRPSDWLKWSFFKTIVSLSGKSTNQFHWVIPLIQKMRHKKMRHLALVVRQSPNCHNSQSRKRRILDVKWYFVLILKKVKTELY
jgi:hypothetical protein